MAFKIVRNDIAKVKADVIVNSANPEPICGGSSDLSIYNAAGYDDLLKAREEIGKLAPGDIGVTDAFQLQAKHIIHTVGPVWNNGKSGELNALRSCYEKSLAKALELNAKSIAFPLISSGVYEFPKEVALAIAVEAFETFLQKHELEIILVVYDKKSFVLSEELFRDVENFLSEKSAEDVLCREFINPQDEAFLDADTWDCERSQKFCDERVYACAITKNKQKLETLNVQESSVEEWLNSKKPKKEDTFQERLFHLIQAKNLDDTDVYKHANLDRKHFSKIRSNVDYKPKKKTALALAIAMQLNMEETRDLLARAELAFSPASRFDLIVSYFIEKRKYKIETINTVLFNYGEPQLGA